MLFVLHSIALLWPSEWEVISRLFIVDQPISIHCFKETTPSGPTTQYTTQPGKSAMLGKMVHLTSTVQFQVLIEICYMLEVILLCFDLFWLLNVLDSFDISVYLLVQICVGSAERASFSSSRGTSESTPKQRSTSAKSSKTRGYAKKDTVFFSPHNVQNEIHRFSIVDADSK